MKYPLVSILIPVYNTDKFVAEAIESALYQTYKNIEIIVVDDGSTDKSWEIIESYRKKYPSIIKTHKQENKGACAARNKGFELSSGQYIQYLDADDLLAPDKIQHQIKFFDGSGNDDFLVNGMWKRFEYSIDKELDDGLDDNLQKDLNPIEWIIINRMTAQSAWLTPRNLISEAGKWSEELITNQDGEYFCRVIIKSKMVYYCGKAKTYYRIHNNPSISTNYRDKNGMLSYLKSIESIKKTVLTVENSFRTRKYIANLYQGFLYRYYPQFKEINNYAFYMIKTLEKPDLKPTGSKLFTLLIKLLGWKTAYWIRFILHYNKWKIE